MSQQFNVAVVGADQAVGQAIIELLEEQQFPVAMLCPVGDQDSDEQTIRFAGKSLSLQAIEEVDWSELHFAFFCTTSACSEQWAEVAAEQGCVVIDNSGLFSGDEQVPLVIPAVNGDALMDFRARNVVASPTSEAVQLLLALKGLHDEVGISRINVASYQSVSCLGQAGVSELAGQTAQLLNARPVEPVLFPQQIAFNLIAQMGAMADNGYSLAEMRLVWECQKVLADSTIGINPTSVYVPVFHGVGQAVHVELHQMMDAEQAKTRLQQTPKVRLCEEDECPTLVGDAIGQDKVLVSRVRADISHPNGINLWIVADNLKQGAAGNMVDIATALLAYYDTH